MRIQTLPSHDATQVIEFSSFSLREGEGTEPEDCYQMIHIDNKYIIPGNSIPDLVTSVHANIHENNANY